MRSKRGIYLEVSPFYLPTAHLVLNSATGSITPQYHLIFDDTFSIVFSDGQFDPSIWTYLLSHGYELHATVQPDSTGTVFLLIFIPHIYLHQREWQQIKVYNPQLFNHQML